MFWQLCTLRLHVHTNNTIITSVISPPDKSPIPRITNHILGFSHITLSLYASTLSLSLSLHVSTLLKHHPQLTTPW